MKKQLHSGAKWIFRLGVFWTAIFLAIFLGSFLIPMMIGFEFLSTTNILGAAIIFMILIIFTMALGEIWVRMAYNNWSYEFTDSNLRQERGVIWKTYSNVPYDRIQNIDIRRGIIARILGFSSVHIQTAGYSVSPNGAGYGAEGYIPAVEIKEAENIRDFIIKKVHKGKGRQGL